MYVPLGKLKFTANTSIANVIYPTLALLYFTYFTLLGAKLPEDDNVVPKHVAVIKFYTIAHIESVFSFFY